MFGQRADGVRRPIVAAMADPADQQPTEQQSTDQQSTDQQPPDQKPAEQRLVELRARVAEGFPASLSPVAETLTAELVELTAVVDERHHAGNGYLHAGALVTLADTACGYGALAGLPDGAEGFTTIELKSNHLTTIAAGPIAVSATRVHGGRSTQVWDATVVASDTGRTLSLFRCTQMILYP